MPAIVDQLIRSKRKTIAILIQRDGKVIVRAPLKTSERVINAFVESKSTWISEKKALAQQRVSNPIRQFINGEKLPLLGKQITLRLVEDHTQRTALTLQNEFLLTKKAQTQAAGIFEKWYKAYAAQIITERVKFHAAQFGFHYEKIRITSARTRWGSCSSRGTLSFTWRLVMAPLEVVDYVVIHELAHLKIKNHSAVFWAEVGRLMPAYQSRRDWLKKNGHLMTLTGEE
ncbi:MAG: SprT family zinc-dependent metalloprotease [Chloroflexota bacterium]